MSETTEHNNVMVYLNGSKTSFRCEVCGANVFHKPDDQSAATPGGALYACNGCATIYSGEGNGMGTVTKEETSHA